MSIEDQSVGYSGQLQNPLNFNRPGDYNYSSGNLYYRGASGHFWTSMAYNAARAFNFDFSSSDYRPWMTHEKGFGFSVRCVAR